jgi:ribonuclease R
MDKKLLKERKKKILDLFSDSLYVPMKIKELAIFMQVSKSERQELNEVIDELLEEGKIQISQKGKLSLKNEEILTGTFISHQNGFGFIEIEGR